MDRYPRAGDPHLKELAARALDAARAAGATYAEVRFTLTDTESMGAGRQGSAIVNDWRRVYRNTGHVSGTWNHGIVGVRALAGGAWGFSASATWTTDEVARLGREAAVQAQGNAIGRQQKIEWTPRPAVVGTWKTPVRIDPFTISLAEKIEVLQAFTDRVSGRYERQHNTGWSPSGAMGYTARRHEMTFGSTEGSWITQTQYRIEPFVAATVSAIAYFRDLDRLQPCAKGWEVMLDPAYYDEVPQMLEESALLSESEPPTPNRYDIVCDATVVAQILAQTVGVATELDRVLGYEANAGGTSYLGPVDDVLGRYTLGPTSGPNLLNITANRSMPGMIGTTPWDDEGVAPAEYPVIADGVLVGYHTNRELAPVLAAWDASRGRPSVSRGCAVAETAQHVPVVQPPNLVMAPSKTDTTFDDLVAGLEHGLVFMGGNTPRYREAYLGATQLFLRVDEPLAGQRISGSVTVDRQQLNGELQGSFVYEVRNGKRVRILDKGLAQGLFRAPELWKNLQALGGASTQMDAGCLTWKGEPGQGAGFGVRACAARFKQVAVTDARRKA